MVHPRLRCWLALALAVFGGMAAAQEYPARPIRVILPFPPGGSSDIYGRIVASGLLAAWGKPVIVDNRPGGTGVIGTQTARLAAPDGYTLLFTSNTGHILGPLLIDPRPFDPVGDFTPVSMVIRFPLYLIVHPSIPGKTVADFVAYAKARPRQLNYASSGLGGTSHLAAELFNAAAGISATHLPYKGASPAQQAVMAGEAQYRFDNIGTSHPFVVSGKLRGLAVTGPKRSQTLPDVPTVGESGLRGLEGVYTWLGMLGPAGLPSGLLGKLSTEVIRIMHTPEIGKRALNDGYDVIASAPAQFAADMKSEVATWSRLVREKGIKAE